jgi:hypothetical protein
MYSYLRDTTLVWQGTAPKLRVAEIPTTSLDLSEEKAIIDPEL